MRKPDDIPQGVWDDAGKVADELASAFVPEKYIMTIARAIMTEREACAKIADEIGAGRSRQCSAAKSAKKRTEARDFESMAMSAIDVGYSIRSRP